MPALGMAQETGTLIRWLKAPGDSVAKGEPLMEVETDKASVEVEATANGILANVTAQPNDVIPVGQRIALILALGEVAPPETKIAPATATESKAAPSMATVTASPIAARIAAEHKLDLAQIKPQGGRVQKEDVLAYLAAQTKPAGNGNGRALASPKARRLAQESGIELHAVTGSGPEGAVLTADVMNYARVEQVIRPLAGVSQTAEGNAIPMSRMWRVMVERLTTAWATIPHFYLQRDVDATALTAWQADAQRRTAQKITITDLLVKLTAAALAQHPRVNSSWRDGNIYLNTEINIGLAVAVEDGLLVPVIYQADTLGLNEIAAKRRTLVLKAQTNKLSPDEMSGGTFTISNLGMYGVDQFKAIVNPPQAAILAVGRIADRVVPVNGQPAVRPMLTLSLSCDHRVVDGARGAQFLQTLAELIESPLRLLD